MYSKKTAEQFIPKLHELTFETLESLTNVELSESRKHFLQRVITAVETLLKRFKTEQEIDEIVESFKSKIGIEGIEEKGILYE